MRTAAVLAVAVALVAATAHATFMGIDFGAEFIKVAAPTPESAIDIVLNEQSRRKSFNFIGFRGEERFIGDDAKNLAPRFPGNMFPMVSKLPGLNFSDPRSTDIASKFHIYSGLVANEKRGTVDVKCLRNPDTVYTSDELVGMLIAYCRDITHRDTSTKPVEAVITIPHSSDMWQRAALVQAAGLANIQVLGLMHATTATALQFGIQNRGFGNETVVVVVFSMGSVAADVGVYRIRPTPPPKGGGRVRLSVSLGTIETLAIVSDADLGGRTFDTCVANSVEKEFVAAGIPEVLSGSTEQKVKAAFSLMRSANHAREVLSANPVTPITVEGVQDDRKYTTKMTREAFESTCDHLFVKVVALAKRAMKAANVTADDVRNFEMMGGASRMPRVIADVSELIGRPVDRTLNGDESGAFGAAYHAARMSSRIRVKSFAIADAIPEAVTFDVSRPEGGFSARRPLFPTGAGFVGSSRSITVNRTANFQLRFFVTRDGVDRHYGTVDVTGVTDAMYIVGAAEPTIPHPNNTVAVRIQATISDAGIVAVTEAELLYRAVVNKTKKVKAKPKAKANETADANENSSAPVKPAALRVVSYLGTKRKQAVLTFAWAAARPLPMDSEDIAASKAVLTALEIAEKVRRDTATAKNTLESYIQWMKYDSLLDNDEAKEKGFLTSEQEAILRAFVAKTQEWIEDGRGSEESCTKAEFNEQLIAAKAEMLPLWTPYDEYKNPPPPVSAKKKDDTKKKNATKKKATNKKASKKATPQEDGATKNDSASADEL